MRIHWQGFDYQSVCHYSKTTFAMKTQAVKFDYQSVCHYSKTAGNYRDIHVPFDYQSVCHYSKTTCKSNTGYKGLTTSQFVTTPKQEGE